MVRLVTLFGKEIQDTSIHLGPYIRTADRLLAYYGAWVKAWEHSFLAVMYIYPEPPEYAEATHGW